MRSVGRRAGDQTVVDGATVTARVDIGAIGGGRFGPAVRLEADVAALPQAGVEDLVARGHGRCRYSNATRGNIEVGIEVRGPAAVRPDP
jgi:organic hydroperoxide reductase OsmC/OhrA